MYNFQIKTFICVVENGSFTKAAEILYISPVAVMKQINALEKRINVRLFDRVVNKLEITEAGKSIYKDAKYIIDYSKRAIANALTIQNEDKYSKVRIGTSIMTPAKFLLDIWTKNQVETANIPIELVPFNNTPENAREILMNLGNHIDVVAGIYDEGFLQERGCKAAYIEDKSIYLAIPISHPLASKTFINKNDLKGHKLLLITKGWTVVNKMREELINKGIEILDFDFFNLDVFNSAVLQNVPIMAIEGWENIHPLLKIIKVDWNYTIPFGVMYSKKPTNIVKKFIKLIEKSV